MITIALLLTLNIILLRVVTRIAHIMICASRFAWAIAVHKRVEIEEPEIVVHKNTRTERTSKQTATKNTTIVKRKKP